MDRVPTAHLTRPEIRLMLATAKKKDAEGYLALRLLYFGGLRTGDLLGLGKGDLIRAQRTAFLRGGKGDKDRYVLLDPETAQRLAEYALPFPQYDEWVRMTVHKVAEKCGLYQAYAAQGLRVSSHSLRHAFATHRYEAGMSFALISHLLGHALAEDTVTYVRAASRQMRTSYDRCGPFAAVLRERQSEQQAEPPEPSLQPSQVERQIEFLQQPAAARLNGLPAVPGPDEVDLLLNQAASRPHLQLFLRVLHCSGCWLQEMLALRPEHIDADRPVLHLPTGLVRIDPETWRRLKESPGPWGPKRAEVMDFFMKTARATGLAARFLAMKRPVGPDVLRYAFATSCVVRNVDPLSLMTLLGHRYFETAEAYFHCAPYRFLDQYDATTEPEVEP